jgi:hypothetical protein
MQMECDLPVSLWAIVAAIIAYRSRMHILATNRIKHTKGASHEAGEVEAEDQQDLDWR